MFPKRQCGKRSNIFMCGIIGFTGKTNAVPLLLDGLSALEYRGYDSAGIAVFGKNGDLEVYKSKGRLAVVAEKIASLPEPLVSTCGIGHTRWATHGEPSDINAHPHGTKTLSTTALSRTMPKSKRRSPKMATVLFRRLTRKLRQSCLT